MGILDPWWAHSFLWLLRGSVLQPTEPTFGPDIAFVRGHTYHVNASGHEKPELVYIKSAGIQILPTERPILFLCRDNMFCAREESLTDNLSDGIGTGG